MPNLRTLAAKELEKKKKELDALENAGTAERKRQRAADYTQVVDMFQHPGWPILKAIFQKQHDAALSLMKVDEPIDDVALQTLRAQITYADRIITLDVEIAERLNSLRKQLKDPE